MSPKSHSRFVVADIARENAARSGVSLEDWSDVLRRGLEGLRGQDVEPEGLAQIARACRTPKQFALMVRLISQHCRATGTGKEIFELIRKHRDQAVFSLTEWMDALDTFTDWLESNHHNLDFLNMLNYIQCATLLPEAKSPGAHLEEVLLFSIEKYGVSWATSRR